MTTIPANTIYLRRVWRNGNDIEPIHFQLASGDTEREFELTRATYPGLYDFIEANAPTIPSVRG